MTVGIRRLDDPARYDEHGQPIPLTRREGDQQVIVRNLDGTPKIETVRELILRNARIGMPADLAAQAGGIPWSTYKLWISAGREIVKRTLSEPDADLTDEELMAGQFATDVDRALGEWASSSNLLLEAGARGRQIRTVKEVVRGDVTERTTVIRDEPGDLTTLTWRLGKVFPERYGAQRIELTGVEGRPVEVDISAKLDELVGSIRAALTTDEPAASNGHEEA